MKNNCNVARDLMPLVIDGVASEESKRLVAEHVKECNDCASLFADMHDELPGAVMEDQEQAQLNVAAKRTKQRRILRALIVGLLGMAMGVLLAVNFDEIVFRAKYVKWNGDLKFDAVYTEVFQQRSGCWSVMHNSIQSGSPCFSPEIDFCYTEDGTGAYLQFRLVYKGMESDEWDWAYIGTWGNCFDEVWSIPNYDSEARANVPILWVEVLSGSDSRVIWRQGDRTKTQQDVDEYLAQFGY